VKENINRGISGQHLSFLDLVVLVGYLLENKGVDIEAITFKEALIIILAFKPDDEDFSVREDL